MPQVVAGWVITAVGVSATGVAASLITAAVGLAANLAIAKLLQPKGRSPKDNQIEIRQSDAPRTRYLGRNRVSGAVMYWDVHSRALWKLFAVAQGGHNGVIQWYLGDKPVEVLDGTVLEGQYDGKVALWARSGVGIEINGGAYGPLIAAAPHWTAAHRLHGVGTMLARFDCVKAEDAQEIFPGGEPKVTAVIEGASLRHPDGTLFGPSANLARQLYDILTHPDYGPLAVADLDAPSWQLAVNICNAALPTAGGTRPRYAGGGGYQLSEPIKDVAERWLAGMAGTIYLTTDGKVGIRVGKWVGPTYTISEDKIVGMEYGVGADQLDGVASLTPKYVSPDLAYQETTADPWEDAAAMVRWGETAGKEMPLPVVHHHGQARSLAKIALAKLNPKWRFTMRLRFWGLLLLDEPTVRVHLPRLGILNEPFWIDRYAFDPNGDDGVVTVTLIHADPASFDWSAAEEGTPAAVPPRIETGPTWVAPVITSAEVIKNDGPPFIRVTYQVEAYETGIGQYRRSDSTGPWTAMQQEGLGGSLRTLSLEDASEYDVRVGAAFFGGKIRPNSNWTTLSKIEVIDNAIAPDSPVIVAQSGTAGGALSVTFEPDLGINYHLTRLHRGAAGSTVHDSVAIKASTSTAQQVTLKDTIPAAGAKYWLISENGSGVKSTAVLVGNYT